MNKLMKIAGALAIVIALGAVAYAGVAELGYVTLKSPPPAKNYALQAGSPGTPAAVDSQVWTAAVHPKRTLGNPTACILCEMTTASATATVRCGLFHDNGDGTDTFLGEAAASQTATAGSTATDVIDGVTYYPAGLITFDTRGADYIDVRLTTISAGVVSVKTWVCGSSSQ